jgi:hypothetical protein
LFSQMRADGSGIGERFCHRATVMKAPVKVWCHDPVQRVDVGLEQSAGESLEQLVSFGG